MSEEKCRLRVLNQTRQSVLGTSVTIADTTSSRLIGLLGRRRLNHGSGLLIHPSSAVHTIGMLFTIDVLFLDAEKRVIGLCPSLRPFRISPIYFRAKCALELPSSVIDQSRTEAGDVISFEFAD